MTEDASLKEPKEKPIILYIGSDKTYFKNLKAAFLEQSKIEAHFKSAFSTDAKVIQSFTNRIRTLKPKLILLDFTREPENMLRLARIWTRQNYCTKINIIALTSVSQGQEIIIKAVMASVCNIHIKSTEMSAVIYDMVALGFFSRLEQHAYAIAALSDNMKAYFPAKISIVSEDGFQLESNIDFLSGAEVKLHTYWSRKNILKTATSKLKTSTQENLYYNYKFNQKFNHLFAPPIVATEDLEAVKVSELQNRREELVQDVKYQYKKWLTDHAHDNNEKLFKAFVIDKSGTLFENSPLSDSYPFVLRVQPFIKDIDSELKRVAPQLIAFNLENVSEEPAKEIAYTFNDSKRLQALVKSCKSLFEGTPPLILIFNCPDWDTEYLQKTLSYSSIIAVEEKINHEIVLQMTTMVKKKLLKNIPALAKDAVVINKKDPLSFAEIEAEIMILGISESDIFFDSTVEILPFSTFRIFLPKPVIITVIPVPEHVTVTSNYYGLINGIGEMDRQGLRQFINAVFFRDKAMQVQISADEAEEKKKQFMEKKEAIAQKESLDDNGNN